MTRGQVAVNIELIGLIIALVMIVSIGIFISRAWGVSDTDIISFESFAKDLNSLSSSQIIASKAGIPLDLSSNGIIVLFGSKQTTLTDVCGRESVTKPAVPECREACACLYADTANDDETFQSPPVRCASLGRTDTIIMPTYYKGEIGSWERGGPYRKELVPEKFKDLPDSVLANMAGEKQALSSGLQQLYDVDASQVFIYGQCEDWIIDEDLGKIIFYAESVRLPGEESVLFLTAQNSWADSHKGFVLGKLAAIVQGKASEAFEKQDWENSRNAYQTLVNEFSQRIGPEVIAEARAKLAVSLWRLNKKDEALIQLQQLETKNNNLADAVALVKARIAIEDKNDVKTGEELDSVSKSPLPDIMFAKKILKADLLEKKGKWQEAKQLLITAPFERSPWIKIAFTDKELDGLTVHSLDRFNHIEAEQLTPQHIEKVFVQGINEKKIVYTAVFDAAVFQIIYDPAAFTAAISKVKEGTIIPYGQNSDERITTKQVLESASSWCANCPVKKIAINNEELEARLPALTQEQQALLVS